MTPIEQAKIFRSRAQELERRAATTQEQGGTLKDTLLKLADYYGRLAEEAAEGPTYRLRQTRRAEDW
jgi:hypothetical protein